MSAFKVSYQGYEFTIVLDKDPLHHPIERWEVMTDEDKELIASGEMAFYNVTLTSSKLEESVVHFIAGVQLPVDEELQAEDLEEIIAEEEIFENVIKHWNLRLSSLGKPSWA